MRHPFIAGNWKMFKTVKETVFYVKEFRSLVKDIEDAAGDAAGGARTLPLRWGRRPTAWLALAVVFVTRTGLDIHRQTVDLVHLLGARDRYIARLFERHALAFGFVGGVLGLAAAAATISAIALAVHRLAAGLLPAVTLGLAHWAALAALPIAAAGIAMLTARVTVLRTLAKGP